jgi:hypothetical protein
MVYSLKTDLYTAATTQTVCSLCDCTVFTMCSCLLTFFLSSCVLAPLVSKSDA